jgi:hypothetical protein
VPIVYTDPWEEVVELLEKVNGVLLPGGILTKEHYYFSKKLYWWVKFKNMEGHFLPLFGICQGFQYMASFEHQDGNESLEYFASLENEQIDFQVNPLKESWFFSSF